ncbi:MAG: hypothetical protein ACHRXM_16545 [Isosphaerales bacterium]
MRLSRVTFSLWHSMVVIALFAVIAAGLGVWIASGLLVAASLIAIPIVLTKPGRRLEAAAWTSFVSPILYYCGLNAIWFTARFNQGHQPRWIFDDPDFVSLMVSVPLLATLFFIFMLILPFALLMLCVPLMVAAISQKIRRKEIGVGGAAVRLSIPLFLWFLVYAIARWSAYILKWFLN